MTRRRDLTGLAPSEPRAEPEPDEQTLVALSPPLVHEWQSQWWAWAGSSVVMPPLVAGSAQLDFAEDLRSRRLAELRAWWAQEIDLFEQQSYGDHDEYDHIDDQARRQLYRHQRVAALVLNDWRKQVSGSWWVSRRHERIAQYIADARKHVASK